MRSEATPNSNLNSGSSTAYFSLDCFKKFPKRELLFITIKDNSGSSKWTKIGKINDWIRKYANKYIIVKGTVGGTHFHLFAHITKGNQEKMRFQKGIHFHVMNMAKQTQFTREQLEETLQTEDERLRIKYSSWEDIVMEHLDLEQQAHLTKITLMISDYWKKKRSKARLVVRTKELRQGFLKELDRVGSYLHKNLNEYRPEEIQQFVDYIEHAWI